MTEIDGIPVFTVPRSGKVHGGLCFRVGMADENFGNHGITHLIEHLAFDGLADQSIHSNGMTTDTYTMFYATGEPDEVIGFLNKIAHNLSHLPLERLDKEKEILRTEGTRHQGPVQEARNTLHGIRDFGLGGVWEAGLNRLSAEEVRQWAARYFTAGNVAAFISCDEGLDQLSLGLPAGSPQPVPTPSLNPAADPLPRNYPYRSNVVILQAIVERGAGIGVLEELAKTRFMHELREIDALSYSPSADTEPVGPELTRFTYVADTVPDNGTGVAGCLIDALEALCHGRFSDAELDQAKRDCMKIFDQEDAPAGYLLTRAINRVYGRDDESMDQMRARYAAVTREDVVRTACAVRDHAFWVAPLNSLQWAGIEPVSFFVDPVEGHEFPRLDGEGTIIVSDKGVTRATDKNTFTVLFDQCVGVEAYPDGLRSVVGASGIIISIEPTLYQGMTPALLSALIDSRVTPDHLIPMPARRPDEIPHPAKPDPVPTPATMPAATPGAAPAPAYQSAQPVPGQAMPGQAAPGYVPGQPLPATTATGQSVPANLYAAATGYAAPAWTPPPKRRTGLLVLFVVLAIFFGLIALFSVLMVAITAGDHSEDGRSVLGVFTVMLVVTGIPTIIFIWQAVRANRPR